MAGTLLSPRFWPWRLGVAMGLPWLFRFLLDHWLAMGLSGAFFGISHATNAGATSRGGVFLAACYLRYGSLWVPIAFHFAWDTTMGVVLGLPVSGTPLPGLLHVQMTGPEAWTGGGFGPEASTALQPFIFAAAAFYLWKVVVERKLSPPPWRARPVPARAVPAPASIPSTRGPAA